MPSHLWVVTSDVEQDSEQVVIANLTSRQFDIDTSCVLTDGDHPFIVRDTVIAYDRAQCVSLQVLENLLHIRQIHLHESFSAHILCRIRTGLMRSPHTIGDLKDIIKRQNLVDPSEYK